MQGCTLEDSLLDKIFKVLTEGPTLRSSVYFLFMKGIIVSHSGTSKVVCFCLRMLRPELNFDGFKDVLDRELQLDEAIGCLIGLELALLRVQESLLLKRTMSVTLEVNRGVSVLRYQFCSGVTAVET